MIRLNISRYIEARLREEKGLIQVIIGPRQVGKTTAILQALDAIPRSRPRHYATADAVFRGDWSWIERQWIDAQNLGENTILVLDEIQKIENWSEIVKKLWDESITTGHRVRLVLLGSSSLAMQVGLSESLTGRFELLRAFHWNFKEYAEAFQVQLEQYLAVGGYPGSHMFINDKERWLNYLKDSIIETVIDKDIMQLRKVERPALFKQVFELCCSYPAQEISLRKLVGQLQDSGSVDTVKNYLNLLEGAFLVKSLQKYTTNALQAKSSSPKILPMCPAFCTFFRRDLSLSAEERGRIFELVVGLDLLRLQGDLYYWREGNDEVDYVYKEGKRLIAIEVKSGRKKSLHGLTKFCSKFKESQRSIITPENYSLFSINPLNFIGSKQS